MRTIVSVGTDKKFAAGMERLQSLLPIREKMVMFYDAPPNSLPHHTHPYAFKLAAIESVLCQGGNPILWCDSSVIPLKMLDPIWKLIETQGYWFSKNYDYTQGEFCSDAALDIYGVTREQAFGIPQVVASCFGLDFRHDIAQDFMRQWNMLAERGAFAGPWGVGASADLRVRGHRHDQSAAAHVAWKLGMKLTEPPDYFCEEGSPASSKTILTLKRPR